MIWATSLMYFYPRPLRGGRQPSVSAPGCNYIFLSTPSARRATGESCHRGCRRDISIHALCEEGDPENVVISKMPEISIHALCEEGDGAGLLLSTCKQLFLSTPSARRATARSGHQVAQDEISIHALCEEGDRCCRWCCGSQGYFYPRPLRGGRPVYTATPTGGKRNFYPRPLRGGRQALVVAGAVAVSISIHALCEEGDRAAVGLVEVVVQFLSTPSARRATS